jgi:hypothetical protein
LKEISGLKLAEGLTPHEVRKNGWTEEQPIEGIFEKKDKHAVVVYGPNPLDNEISFLHKPLPGGDEVYGLFHADNDDEGETGAASIAKRVVGNGQYSPVLHAGEIRDIEDNLSLHLDQAHSVVYYNIEKARLTQSIVSAVLIRVIDLADGKYVASANTGKGIAYKVPSDIEKEMIQPLFVEPVDNKGEYLQPVIGQEGFEIVQHPPFNVAEGDKIVMMSGPVKPDIVSGANIYDEIREAFSYSDDKLEVAAKITASRKKIGQACLAAVIEI